MYLFANNDSFPKILIFIVPTREKQSVLAFRSIDCDTKRNDGNRNKKS